MHAVLIFVLLFGFAGPTKPNKKAAQQEDLATTTAYDGADELTRKKLLAAWRERVKSAEEEIAAARVEIKKLRSAAKKNKANDSLEVKIAELASFKRNDPPFIPEMPQTPLTGDVGTVSGLKLVRIVGENKMLVRRGEKIVCVRRLETENLKEGDDVRTPLPLQVIGTFPYMSKDGIPITVVQMQPYELPAPYSPK